MVSGSFQPLLLSLLVLAGTAAAPPCTAAQEGSLPAVRWERPPEGTLERGLLGVPAWVVLAGSLLVIAGAVAALARSARRARRRSR